MKRATFTCCLLMIGAAAQAQAVRTQHYDVHSALAADVTQKIAQHLEAMHAAYARGFASFPAKDETGRTPVYILADQTAYVRFLNTRQLRGASSGGLFFRKGDEHGLVTFKGDRPLHEVLRTLRHEGFHRFAYERLGAGLPLWLNEGLAEYFAESILVGDRLLAGQVPIDKLTLLQSSLAAGTLQPLGSLFALNEPDWNRVLREDHGSALYPQAWSVIHYMMHGPPHRRAAFGRYIGDLAADTPPAEAFTQAFKGERLTDFEKDWRQYARSLKPTPILEAARRLEFLGHGLKWTHEAKKNVQSVDELRRAMQRVRFRMKVAYGAGARITLDSSDSHWFEPPKVPGAAAPATLQMVPPRRPDMPPGLVVRGLAVNVLLSWQRNPQGGWSPQVTYEPAGP